MSRRPKLPELGYGGGSLRWDDERECFELQHRAGSPPRRFVERGTSPRECIAKRDERRAALARPDHRAGADVTVLDVFDEWLPFASAGKAAKTLDGYRFVRQHVAASKLGTTKLSALRPLDVSTMLLAEAKAGTSKASIVKMMATLSMAFDHAVVQTERIAANPMSSVSIPKGTATAKRTAHLDDDEAAIMTSYLVEHHTSANVALLVMLMCGLRPGEALGLRWENVRLDDGELDVRTTLRRMGTGVGDHVVEGTKTSHLSDDPDDDAARRTVPIPPALVRVLQRERREQLARSGRSDYVFADRAGRHHKSGWLWKPAAAAAAAIETSAKLTPNSFRHTFGSLLWNAGMAPTDVAALMGHRDAAMLIKVYGHPRKRRPDTAAYFGAMAQ